MENFSLLFPLLTRWETCSLPEVSAVCEALLNDPAAMQLSDPQLKLVVHFFCSGDAIANEFLLEWVLRVLEFQNQMQKLLTLIPLGQTVVTRNPRVLRGRVFFGQSMEMEMQSSGFNSIPFSEQTKAAWIRAHLACTSLPLSTEEKVRYSEKHMLAPTKEASLILSRQNDRILRGIMKGNWLHITEYLTRYLEHLSRIDCLVLSAEIVINLAATLVKGGVLQSHSFLVLLWKSLQPDSQGYAIKEVLQAMLDPDVSSEFWGAYLDSAIAVGFPLWQALGPEVLDCILDFERSSRDDDYDDEAAVRYNICKSVIACARPSLFRSNDDEWATPRMMSPTAVCRILFAPEFKNVIDSQCTSLLVDILSLPGGKRLFDPQTVYEQIAKEANGLSLTPQCSVHAVRLCLFFEAVGQTHPEMIQSILHAARLALDTGPIVKSETRQYWFGRALPTLFYLLPMEMRNEVLTDWRTWLWTKDFSSSNEITLVGASLPCALRFIAFPMMSLHSMPDEHVVRQWSAPASLQSSSPPQIVLVEKIPMNVFCGICRWFELFSTANEQGIVSDGDLTLFVSLAPSFPSIAISSTDLPSTLEEFIYAYLTGAVRADAKWITAILTTTVLNPRLKLECFIAVANKLSTRLDSLLNTEKDELASAIISAYETIHRLAISCRAKVLADSTKLPFNQCHDVARITSLATSEVFDMMRLLYCPPNEEIIPDKAIEVYAEYESTMDEEQLEVSSHTSSEDEEGDDDDEYSHEEEDENDTEANGETDESSSIIVKPRYWLKDWMVDMAPQSTSDVEMFTKALNELKPCAIHLLKDSFVSLRMKHALARAVQSVSVDIRFRTPTRFIYRSSMHEWRDASSVWEFVYDSAAWMLKLLTSKEEIASRAWNFTRLMAKFGELWDDVLSHESIPAMYRAMSPFVVVLLRTLADPNLNCHPLFEIVSSFVFMLKQAATDDSALAVEIHSKLTAEPFSMEQFLGSLRIADERSGVIGETFLLFPPVFPLNDFHARMKAVSSAGIIQNRNLIGPILYAYADATDGNIPARQQLFSVGTHLLQFVLAPAESRPQQISAIEVFVDLLHTLALGPIVQEESSSVPDKKPPSEPPTWTTFTKLINDLNEFRAIVLSLQSDSNDAATKNEKAKTESPTPPNEREGEDAQAGTKRRRLIPPNFLSNILEERFGALTTAEGSDTTGIPPWKQSLSKPEQVDDDDDDDDDDLDDDEEIPEDIAAGGEGNDVERLLLPNGLVLIRHSDGGISSSNNEKKLAPSLIEPTASEHTTEKPTEGEQVQAKDEESPVAFKERLLISQTAALLLPACRRCVSEKVAGECAYYRCVTCFPSQYQLLCSACAHTCHAGHSLEYEDRLEGETCDCPRGLCKVKTRQVRRADGEEEEEQSVRLGPAKRKLPRPPVPYLVDQLFEHATVSALTLSFQELFQYSVSKMESVRAASTEHTRAEFHPVITSGSHSYLELFDLWKGVESSKQILEHLTRSQLVVRRLAACPLFLAVCEGNFISIVNPASLVCAYRTELSKSNSLNFQAISQQPVEVLSQTEVGFAGLQVEFNEANPRLLAACGITSCHVLAFGSNGKLIKKVQLVYNADANDPIRKIAWVPGSKSELCVITGLRVRVFDLFVSNKPLFSYKLAEEIAPLADGVFLIGQPNVLLLLSSSGCLLRQDLSIRDDKEELLICELLCPPSSDSKSAISLSVVDCTNVLVHHSSGLMNHYCLDSQCTRVFSTRMLDDDEPGSGRATGVSVVVNNKFILTSACRSMRTKGSVMVYNFVKNDRDVIETLEMKGVIGLSQLSVGRLAGVVSWSNRVIALFENGSIAAYWQPPLLPPLTLIEEEEKTGSKDMLMEQLIKLDGTLPPLEEKTLANLRPSSHISAGLYYHSLGFGARSGFMHVRNAGNVLPVSTDPTMRSYFDTSTDYCLVGETGTLDLIIALASPLHTLMGFKLCFGRFIPPELLPQHVRVFDKRTIALTSAHFRPCPTNVDAKDMWTPVVVNIVLNEQEAREARQTGVVKLTLMRNSDGTSSVSLDGVECYAIESYRLEMIFQQQTSLDSRLVKTEEWSAFNSIAEIISSARAEAVQLTKPQMDRCVLAMKKISKCDDILLGLAPTIFPDEFEQQKVKTLLFLVNQLENDFAKVSDFKLVLMAKAAFTFPRAFELMFLKSKIPVDKFISTLESAVYTSEFINDETRDVKSLVLPLLVVSMAACRASNDISPLVSLLHRLFSNSSRGGFACDAMQALWTMRPLLVLRTDANQVVTDRVHFQCDACLSMPVRNGRWSCKTCEDFDMCERCFFSSALDFHPSQHQFSHVTVDKTDCDASSCVVCGELRSVQFSGDSSVCSTCYFLGLYSEEKSSAKKKRKQEEDEEEEDDVSPGGTSPGDVLRSMIESCPNQPSPFYIRFVVLTSVLSSRVRHDSNGQFLARLGEKLASSLSSLKERAGKDVEMTKTLLLRYIAYAGKMIRQHGRDQVGQDFFNATLHPVIQVLKDLSKAALTSPSPSVPSDTTFPTWLGLDSASSYERWKDIAWFPAALGDTVVAKKGGLVITCSEDIALDKTLALDPGGSRESLLHAGLDALVSHLEKEQGEDLQALLKSMFIHAHGMGAHESTLQLLVTCMNRAGLKDSLKDLTLEAKFRLSCGRLHALVQSAGKSLLERNKRGLVAYLETRRLSELVEANRDAWGKFCARHDSSTGMNPVRTLVDVAMMIPLGSGASHRPLMLINEGTIKCDNHGTLTRSLLSKQGMNLLTMLRSPFERLRSWAMTLLVACALELSMARPTSDLSLAKLYFLAMKVGTADVSNTAVKLSVKDVERFMMVSYLDRFVLQPPLLVPSMAKDADRSSFLSEEEEKRAEEDDKKSPSRSSSSDEEDAWNLAEGLMVRLRQSVQVLNGKILKSPLETVPLALHFAKTARMTRLKRSLSAKSEGGEPSESTECLYPSSSLWVFDSTPCLHCDRVSRSFATVPLDAVRSHIAFTSSAVVVRLRHLTDIRNIIAEMQPTRRGLTPVLDKIQMFVSSAYSDENNVDLASIAADDSVWEKVAELTKFEPAKVTTATTATAISATLSSQQQQQPGKITSSESIIPECTATLVKLVFVLSKDRSESDRLACPRCSKPVVNDHGVCANCSEMVFQCRQCRNINYEDLRSFLCVQCGFCRHFRFSFKVEMRPSNNYPEIKSEKEYDIALKQMRVLTQTEKTTLSGYHVARSLAVETLATMNMTQFESAMKSLSLRKRLMDSTLTREDSCALRGRLATFRGSKTANVSQVLGRPMVEEEMNDENGCFSCHFSLALSISAALCATVKKPLVAARLGASKESVALLLNARETLLLLDRVPGLRSTITPGAVHLSMDTFDPLLALATEKPSVGVNRVIKMMKQQIELLLDGSFGMMNKVQPALDAVEFLQALAIHPKAGRQLIEAVVGALSLPLTKAADKTVVGPEVEQVALACLKALGKISNHDAKIKKSVSFVSNQNRKKEVEEEGAGNPKRIKRTMA